MTYDPAAAESAPWQVVIIKHGTRATTRSDAYMNYAFYDEPDGPFRLDYFLWVLRRGDEVIVVDTGYRGDEGTRRGREVIIDPLEALRAIGVDPAAGHPVVITHAHYDHIGNIAAFPSSTIHLARIEHEFWTGRMGRRTLFAHFGDPEAVAELDPAVGDGRLALYDEQVEIAPGVTVTKVGGHTPGQSVVTVRTSVGTVILASDAVHFHEEMDRDMLFQSMADLPQSYATLDRLRQSDAAVIVSGHDSGELERHTPLAGPLAGLAATIGEFR
ncbi:N-acyl homoserine lactonase family protein [Microbacterium gorillae]|uniref:N-acyl homoserine lactonase family protein n=1 Tax=Microbacterium gorillae TaxID=1231063 RepID=UPI00058ADB46|nr:N-acyl homoserine lactonase family protein [Microbacterium gorillae]